MSDERRYRDAEVREILERAIGHAETTAPAVRDRSGLTLREIQDVAQEVGVPALRVTEAAAALELRGEALPVGTTLGLPTDVGQVVPLPRNLTDHEWERLVAELRTTFNAPGQVSRQGTSREWWYGSLHVFLEPAEQGYRLRLVDTRAELFTGAMAFGGIMLAFAALIALVLLGKGGPGAKMFVPLFFSLGGLGTIGFSALALPGWARRQVQRMGQVSTFAKGLIGPAPADGDDS